MTTYKRKSSQIKMVSPPKSLLESFSFLFYVCKILGVNSQDLYTFRRYKQLKKSPNGEVLVIIGIIISFINYNLMLLVFQSKKFVMEKNILAIGIGVVLAYYSTALLISDRIYALKKQQKFLNIFNELEEIDEDLRDFNIVLDNNYVKYRLVGGVFVAAFLETLTFTVTFTLSVDKTKWTSWLWVYSCIPTFYNTLDKLWYAGIVIAIRKRFEAINEAFIMESLIMEQAFVKQKIFRPANKFKNQKKFKKSNFKNQIRPVPKKAPNVFGDTVRNPSIFAGSFKEQSVSYPKDFSAFPRVFAAATSNCDALEVKFVKYCQLHDSLCDVAKQLNEVYGFPMLMLMGYGIIFAIAHMYFCFSANVNQTIPSIFRPSKRWWITALYIFYIAAKCVIILYENWLTTLESKKTGICLHRCAMAADKNETYEMINHLSLKLFNHQLNFNACGYFPLNMTTLFSLCGGVATYLIILIQFNVEEQQVKYKSVNSKPRALIRNDTQDNLMIEDVVNGTHIENIKTFISVFYQTWNNYFKNL